MKPKHPTTTVYSHFLGAATFGGVERLLEALLDAGSDCAEHHVLLARKQVDPQFADTLHQFAASVEYPRRWRGIRLPRGDRFERWARHAYFRRTGSQVVVSWNRLHDLALLSEVTSKSNAGVIYYEHSAAWSPALTLAQKQQSLRNAQGVLCCSRAAQRYVQLALGYDGPTAVCLNGVPSRPSRPPRHLPAHRPIRLGVAGRLTSQKALPVALAAFRKLLENSKNVELHIAGEGDNKSLLQDLCVRWRLTDKCRFHGFAADLSDFFENIDVCLHTAAYEPFGLVLAEAQAHGIPVIGVDVDGTPEAVADGEGAELIEPQLSVENFCREIGIECQTSIQRIRAGFPEQVYSAKRDQLVPVGLLDPVLLSQRVEHLLGDPARYTRMSSAGIAYATDRLSLARYRADFSRSIRALLTTNP